MLLLSFILYRFFLASFYTKYEPHHFIVNTIFMLIAVLPKLPMFHGVRLFGINKYWVTYQATGWISACDEISILPICIYVN